MFGVLIIVVLLHQYLAEKTENMNIYNCPKCGKEFAADTKFCQNCGCNLETEIIETPTCPNCKKTHPTGTKFCSEDGTKLVSPDKLIPRCIKCGKEYTNGAKFCPECGGQILVETQNSESIINEDVFKKNVKKITEIFTSQNNTSWRKITLAMAIIIAVIDVYIIFHYFSIIGTLRNFTYHFPLYLNQEVLGWSIFAVILAAITYFIENILIEDSDESLLTTAASYLTKYAGGLAVAFFVVGLFANTIVKILN